MLDVWTVLPSRVLCGTRHNLNPQNPTVLLGGIFLPSAPRELFNPKTFSTRGEATPQAPSILISCSPTSSIHHSQMEKRQTEEKKLQLTTFDNVFNKPTYFRYHQINLVYLISWPA